MSDINLDFTVETNNINFNVEPNEISITPTDIQLSFALTTPAVAAGTDQQVQYNNNGNIAGSAGLTFDYTNNNLSVGNTINSNIANVGSLTVIGQSNLNDISNVHIYGGNINEILKTDGNGNLSWGTSTGVPGNANTTIQFNDNGVFNGSSNFTYNKTTGNVTLTGGLFVGTATLANVVTTNAQPNITSVGNLVDLRVNNNTIHLGSNAALTSQGANAIAIGTNSGSNTQGSGAIAIGQDAGNTQNNNAIAVGAGAGSINQDNGIAIGLNAGRTTQGADTIAIGAYAGYNNQQSSGSISFLGAGIAIGYNAGYDNQRYDSIAIGSFAGSANASGIAIGRYAGATSQGNATVAIGDFAGYPNAQAQNSIVINASGANLDGPTNGLYVKPIRDVTGLSGFTVQLYYNPTTGEIGYK